jgi:ABC-type dipeptide/oligopeptide/nickel transport system permease component
VANLAAFVVRRMFAMIVIIYLIVTSVFVLVHASPVDPIKVLLGHFNTPHNIHSLRERYGLLGTEWDQYKIYLWRLLHGDLGISIGNGTQGQAVLSLIQNRLPVTLKLGVWSLVLSLIVGLPTGLISALRQNTLVDHSGQTIMMLGYVTPAFVLCPLAQLIFGDDLRWLPVQGWGNGGWTGPFGMIPLGDSFKEMILPVSIFAFGLAGFFAKSFRSFMLEVLSQDYVRTARAKGLKSRVVVLRHAARNTLLPLMSIVGPTIAFLVVGAFVIEIFFGIPGIGYWTDQCVVNADYASVEGTTVLLVITVVVVNMLTDIAYAMVDPRVRL